VLNQNKFLYGNHIYIRALQPDDFGEAMVRFISDRDVTKFLVRGTFPPSLEEYKKQYESTIVNKEEVQFAVCDLKTDLYLGIVGLHSIDMIARKTEFRILLGEKSCWGKGYGTEALLLMLAYAFETLNMNKVWLGVNTGNERAFKSYKKAGFTVEGEFRDDIYKNGTYYNVARMSMLRVEYLKLKEQWPISKVLAAQINP
jgi:ribosomal-protein-alanine N-acetyltransferase